MQLLCPFNGNLNFRHFHLRFHSHFPIRVFGLLVFWFCDIDAGDCDLSVARRDTREGECSGDCENHGSDFEARSGREWGLTHKVSIEDVPGQPGGTWEMTCGVSDCEVGVGDAVNPPTTARLKRVRDTLVR